ncbi:MAG TPA: NAD(P)H-hydrate dehydratase, partial [Mycobacteriales bacterium]|nr:NAD(P)H-hydrate dehydratase [Mycobacteriales bacterium]
VTALLTSDRALPPALAALRAAGGGAVVAGGDGDAELLAAADLVVDGLVGIGFTGELRPPLARLAKLLDYVDATVVAVDVPSGVDASTGAVEEAAVRADVTVTFGALKAGLVVDPGADHAGLVDLVDIGLELPPASIEVVDADDVAELLPAPAPESDKYRRGVVGVVAGSNAYPGAALLSVGGALITGVGMVRFVGTYGPAHVVRLRRPEVVVTEISDGDAEAMLGAGRVQAWVVGPGLGTGPPARSLVTAALASDVPVLLDADALTIVAADPAMLANRSSPTVLTPHAGEFARLMRVDRDDVEARRLDHARRAAGELGVTVLLKGSTTVVADPAGAVRVNTAATPYLATAGSGDVLSGICGALLAGGLAPLDAGATAAFLHGLSGLLAAGRPAAPITGGDLIERLPAAIRAVQTDL